MYDFGYVIQDYIKYNVIYKMSVGEGLVDVPQSKPSVFEIVAHESVAAVFRPAFYYVIRILVRKYPEKLGILLKYADEIYMLCDLILQRHYLSHYNASLSENFYYLKRVDVSVAGGRPLNTTLLNLSLLALVFLPYVKAKLDKIFENLRDRTLRQENEDSFEPGKLLKAFLKIYPYIHFALESPFAFYKFSYTLNLLNYHSPVFHVLKIQLVTGSSSENVLGMSLNTYPNSGCFFEKMVSLPSFVIDKIVKFITGIMPAMIFSLQFIEWWYSTEHEMTNSVSKLPIPPPPQPPKVVQETLNCSQLCMVLSCLLKTVSKFNPLCSASDEEIFTPTSHLPSNTWSSFTIIKVSDKGCGLPPHPLQCPLCQKVRSNMAALVSSGFVYCYPCIHHYVTQHGSCPVSQIPSSLDQILRIYSLKTTGT